MELCRPPLVIAFELSEKRGDRCRRSWPRAKALRNTDVLLTFNTSEELRPGEAELWHRDQLRRPPTRSLKDEQGRWIAKLFAGHDPRVVESALMRLVDSLHSSARRRAARKRNRGACTQERGVITDWAIKAWYHSPLHE